MGLRPQWRYRVIVVSLLTLIFTGIATVVSMLSSTTFRPLPFARPETLVNLTAGGNLWEQDTLAQTLRLGLGVTQVATYGTPNSVDAAHAGQHVSASATQTSSNFFDFLS